MAVNDIDKKIKMIFLVIFSIFSIFFSIFFGTSDISFIEVVKVILVNIFGLENVFIDPTIQNIVWNIRLPRILLAFFVGGSLGVSGALVQSILKNPLASPFTMGVSSGSSLGVTLVIVTGFSISGLGIYFQPMVGLIFGIMSILLVIKLTYYLDKSMSTNTLILLGMIFSIFYSAIQNLIVFISPSDARQVLLWQMGSFSMRGWSYIYAILPFFLVGIGITLCFIDELDVLTLGDTEAMGMGVDYQKTIKILLLAVAILTGSAVSLCGVIGFVDLITPHIARKFFGSRHCYVIPASIFIGGDIMVITDLIARTVAAPKEIPIGTVSALIGTPFFIYIFFKERKIT